MNRFPLLFALLAGVGLSHGALAGGTPSNTPIENSVDISFDGASGRLSIPGAASSNFVTDARVDFSFVELDNPVDVTVHPAQTGATLSFRLTNTGNDARAFDIDLSQDDLGSPIGLTYDPSGSGAAGTYSVYLDGGTPALYDVTGLVSTGLIAPDSSVTLTIVAQLPETTVQGDADRFTLLARPLDDAQSAPMVQSISFTDGTRETVFADSGYDGLETSQESYKTVSALISATKAIALASENRDGTFSCAAGADQGGEAFLPGACVNYTITLTNDAAAGEPATDFSFTDLFPAGLTFQAVRSGHDFDQVLVQSDRVVGTVTSLAPGNQAQIVLRFKID